MNFRLITLTILVNIAFIFIYKSILDRIHSNKSQQIKNYLSALLGLNISHLHDAANFFALIKSQTQDLKLQSFAKGASFHFRSLFEELNRSKKTFDDMSFDDIKEDYIAMLYQKESIDLKDILELELLQLSSSSDGRLNIINQSNTEHALIYGNFSLLSKAILNLVENALKYTTQNIKLELQDADNSWQLKISSYGESIPESLARAINNQINDSPDAGHGLNSLNKIMLFHDANLFIDTLENEGTCIRLVFKKYQHKITPTITTKKKSQTLPIKQKQIALVISGLVLGLGLYIVYYNRVTCQAYYKSFAKVDSPDIIQKERKCLQYLKEMDEVLVDDTPEQLYLRYEAETNEKLLEQIHHDFLKQFSGRNQDLVSLIIFNQILTKAPIDYEALIEKEAKLLAVKFPSAPNINFFLSNSYFEKGKYGKAIVYSAKGVLSLIETRLYLHPRLYLVSKVDKNPDNLSQFLATLYEETEPKEDTAEEEKEEAIAEKEQEQSTAPVTNVAPATTTTSNKTEVKNNTTETTSVKPTAENGTASKAKTPPAPQQQSAQEKRNEAIDKLIGDQDKELGLDLDL